MSNNLNFGQLKQRVTMLSGGVIDNLSAGVYLNQRFTALAKKYAWSWSKGESTLTTTAAKSTGTVAVTNGSATVVGTGTPFVANDVGSFIRVALDVSFYKITAVVGQTLTLETPYAGTTNALAAYNVFLHLYSLASDFREFTSLAFWGRLREATQGQLDEWDALRSRGDIPAYYAMRGRDANNTQVVEIWPVPSAQVVLRYEYWKDFPEYTLNTAVPPIAEDALYYAATAEGLAAEMARAIGANNYQRAIALQPLVAMRQQEATVAMAEALNADLKIIGVPTGIRDYRSTGLVNDDQFLSSHDIWQP